MLHLIVIYLKFIADTVIFYIFMIEQNQIECHMFISSIVINFVNQNSIYSKSLVIWFEGCYTK